MKIAPKILKYAQPVWLKLSEFNKERKKILFEGAQGIFLTWIMGLIHLLPLLTPFPAMAATGSGFRSR